MSAADEELTRLSNRSGYGYLVFSLGVAILAILEWYGLTFGLPRLPVIFTILVLINVAFAIYRVRREGMRKDDAGTVAIEVLNALRASGVTLVSVPGDGFTLEHVALTDRGILIIDFELAANAGPITRLQAQIRWLSNLLEQLSGESFPVRGALIRRTAGESNHEIWIATPANLPSLVQSQPTLLTAQQIARAGLCLSRYVRGQGGN